MKESVTGPFKFNITLKELEEAVEFAKKNGSSVHNTITMSVTDTGIGEVISVSGTFDGEPHNITNYDSW